MSLTRIRASNILDADFKNSCRVTSNSNIVLSGSAPTVVDGVTLNLYDRVLVQGQTNPTQNGIYKVTTLGTGSNGTWTRDVDSNASYSLTPGTTVYVEEGTIYADTFWYISAIGNINIGTTNISFTQLFSYVGNVQSNSTVNATNTTTGSFVLAGGIGVAGNVFAGNVYSSGYYYANGTAFIGGGGGGGSGTPSGANTNIQFNDNGAFGGATFLQYYKSSGNLVSTSLTNSTSTSTGSLVLSGGHAVGGNLFVGGITNLNGNLILSNSSVSNAAIIFADGTSINTASSTFSSFVYTGDGSTVNFSTGTQAGPKTNTSVFINGVYQRKSVYSWTGTVITFNSPPIVNSTIEINILQGNAVPISISSFSTSGNLTVGGGVITFANTSISAATLSLLNLSIMGY